jgi:hypothetical protein
MGQQEPPEYRVQQEHKEQQVTQVQQDFGELLDHKELLEPEQQEQAAQPVLLEQLVLQGQPEQVLLV